MADKRPESKWFRICTAGDTADGREISESDIRQAAASYNPAVYGARVNMEHIRGFTPDSPFRMYGDVLETKAENQDGKLRLLARISPTDELIHLVNNKRQKVYTSCELLPDFAKTGGTYLVGLAVTDSPASLGTDMLQFSAGQGDKSPLAARKLQKGSLFTAAQEVQLEFQDADVPDDPSLFSSAVQKLSAALEKLTKPTVTADPAPAKPETPAALSPEVAQFMAETVKALSALNEASSANNAALQTELAGLKQQLASEPADQYRQRPPATGGDSAGYQQTDC
ncbi:GPO family capsid scaffolding protein [Chitiniphilus eburneus]|uniref:GPO family capsid scaffolding protein n=1 Tax=Chitiniphilus eburneus TaxID=2571148 RepID=UPI0035CF350A